MAELTPRRGRPLMLPRQSAPTAYSNISRATAPQGSNARQNFVPGGWFGGWLGVSPYWLNNPGGGGGYWGVTDGSDAQPGTVGEFFRLIQVVYYTAAAFQQSYVLGVLPPGDWDCWAYIEMTSAAVRDLYFMLDPVPAGFSDSMSALIYDPADHATWSILTPTVRALTSMPSTIGMTVFVNQTGAGAGAGVCGLSFQARRQR